jgi:hypothetical protein
MIIYSPVPLEQIIEGIEDGVTAPEEIQVEGILMQVQPIDGQRARIVRLLSPNPQDYLNPRYAPGNLIHYRPSLDEHQI